MDDVTHVNELFDRLDKIAYELRDIKSELRIMNQSNIAADIERMKQEDSSPEEDSSPARARTN